MTVDGLFTRLHAPTVGYHQSFYVEDSILDEDTGQHRWSDVSIRDHWVDGMTIAELVPEISTITEHRVVDTTQFGWNGAWQATDRLHFNFDAYRPRPSATPAARTPGSCRASRAATSAAWT